ncbi:MAG TPA: hypothetical protein VFQ77_03680 [Pseudonocardiaceae bacterium]|jgi:hypothetical protein|nr:hypothetical protein [Pseudonocardiaceae bacterium]
MTHDLEPLVRGLVARVQVATSASSNERNLHHEIEQALQDACAAGGIPWTTYQLNRTPRGTSGRKLCGTHVAHGAVLIEYEPPESLHGGAAVAAVTHAQSQVEAYAELLSEEEGRPLAEYILIIWDGAHLAFGRPNARSVAWKPLIPFGDRAARRMLQHLRDDGAPLVHPRLLAQVVGPDSPLGAKLLPKLFAAVRAATQRGSQVTQTSSLYTEWRRLFGQVVGSPPEQLRELLNEQGRAHGQAYAAEPGAYLYALNTHIALVAKLVAAMSLPRAAHDIKDTNVPIADRIDRLESGRLFVDAGIVNMLNGDYFNWYREDGSWSHYAGDVAAVVDALSVVDFDISRKTAGSTRDLFKGIYMSFVPRALRHALGEYYTPDWLAAHALDVISWTPDKGLLDPTAGSGTFVLEGLKRRLAARPEASAEELVKGLWGLDLNPLAVLTARASLVACLAARLDPAAALRLPVLLADAINPASVANDKDIYEHSLSTELGVISFRLPVKLVENRHFFAVLARVRDLIAESWGSGHVSTALETEFDFSYLDTTGRAHLVDTVRTLTGLHQQGEPGIWCDLLADRFAAGAIAATEYVVGNPPWVKWSQLPPAYARLIKDRCLKLGIFSTDRWVGGIESDIATVITYEVADKYLADQGRLAFFITGTVFANESSQGFRRWRLAAAGTELQVNLVEDYAAVAPFEGASNHATLLALTRGAPTTYPVTYRVWTPPRDGAGPRCVKRNFTDAAEFRAASTCVDLQARPVPGTDAGPWLKGTAAQHAVWAQVFGIQEPVHRARKGVTTDANGIFWVRIEPSSVPGTVIATNNPTCGRRREIGQVRRVIEADHVYPLLRGAGVTAFRAIPDPTNRILVPQRGQHGIVDLAATARRTYLFLATFRDVLEKRSSYRKFQASQGAPYWSLWSTGEYTFSPFKVVWREMSGGRFQAAYIGRHDDEYLGTKTLVPDHKLYFVPCETEDEAAYLTGLLNAPLIAEAVAAYAAQLSLGASVVEYLLIPRFDASVPAHSGLASLAKEITESGGKPSGVHLVDLGQLAATVLDIRAASF